MTAWPGDPTDREKAIADQRLAAVRDAVDEMIAAGPATHPDRSAAVIELSYARIVLAARRIDNATGGSGSYGVITGVIAAELLYRATTGGDS